MRGAVIAGATLGLALSACGSSTGGAGGGGAGGGAAVSQTPPQGETAVKAWLAAGDYKSWHCEAAEHAARSPSPHGFNRICSNDALAAAAAPFPQGAAAVKELWDKAGGSIIGYAVYQKLAADSAGGAAWYWYEDNPSLNPPGGVVADGKGDTGNAKDVCVACHVAAGSDMAHVGAGDFVYTQVK
jgi:hypothetical protein